jgi:hypothetical protein
METENLAPRRGITVDDLGLLIDKSYLTSAALQRISYLPGMEGRIDYCPGCIGRGVMLLHSAGQHPFGQVEGTQRCLILAWLGIFKT